MTETGTETMQSCDLLIRDAWLLTLDAERNVYRSGAVAVTGNTIVAVGPDRDIAARWRATRVFDARGAVVHPGMIDPHLHMSIHLARMIFPDDPRKPSRIGWSEWFNVLEDEDEYVNALIACIEMARNGFTACMEPGTMFVPDTAAAAAEAVGVRACLGDPFIWDTTDGGNAMASELKRAPASAQRARELLGRELKRNRDPNALVRGVVAIYGSGSASEELELAAKRCADENGVIMNQHQNFSPDQVPVDDARFGGGHNLLRFAELGLLDRNVTFTHMNIVRDDEIGPIAKSGMTVVWMPGNYQYYAIAARQKSRMVELFDKGTNLALCVDAAKIWTFGEMARIAYLVARQAGEYVSSESLLEMQTIRAARALGLEHMIGSLEAGKRADLVIRTEALAEALPNINPVMQTIMLGPSRSVDTVICDGKVIFRKGRLTQLDEEAAYRLGRRSTARMLERLGFTPPSAWPVH